MMNEAPPRDPDNEGAVEWIAGRLSPKQYSTLRRLSEHGDRYAYASDVGAPSTLVSLWDFRRGERGCFAPLGLVFPDYSAGDRCNLWKITDLGRRVIAIAARP